MASKKQLAEGGYDRYREATWQVTVVVKVPREWTARDIENVIQRALRTDTPYIGVETRMPARVET